MTVPEESLYERRASTLAGRLGLAGAHAALSVAKALRIAKKKSGLPSREIAQRLGVSGPRVTQVLTGDGNVHVSTAARYFAAMGYAMVLDVRDETGASILTRQPRRGRRLAAEMTRATPHKVTYANAGGIGDVEVNVPDGPEGTSTVLWVETMHRTPVGVSKSFRATPKGKDRESVDISVGTARFKSSSVDA